MARIRTIKPEFWTDETLSECSPSARLLFIATWNFSDDKGNLERSAKQLKAQAFPYDNIDCEPLLQELLRVGVLIEYEASDRKYLHIKGFDKHQKVDKESKPRFPLYDDSATTQVALAEPSASPRPVREGKGRERKGDGATAPVEPLALHESLPAQEWEQWLDRRRKKRWPVDDLTLSKQLEVLREHDTQTQREMLNTSIQAGWQGIFPPKGKPKSKVGAGGIQWA